MRALLLLALISSQAMAFTVVSTALAEPTPLVWYEARGPVTGTIGTLSGYQPVVTNTVNVAITSRMYQRIQPLRLAMNVTTAGVGGGNMLVQAYDTTSAAIICSSTRVCTSATFSIDCVSVGTVSAAVGDDVTLRVDATACGSSPAGTIELSYAGVPADEGVDFIPRFIPLGQYGLDGGGTFLGVDSYQFDSITCGWGTPGIISGGTDTMRVHLIQKSDAGVVCACDLPGTCADSPGTEHTCNCGAVKYLGTQAEPGLLIGTGFAIQWSTATNCVLNPRDIVCAIPFRK